MSIESVIATLESAIPEENKQLVEWPPIAAPTLPEPPPFPLDTLPEVLRNMAESISLSHKAPPSMAASCLLTAVGMAIGRNVYF